MQGMKNFVGVSKILSYNITTKEITAVETGNVCIGCRFNPTESKFNYCCEYNYHVLTNEPCVRYIKRM